MARRSRGLRPRTWFLIAIVVLLLGGMAGGLYWVYDRGLKREGLFDRAQRACREHRYGDSIALARETLASEPNHPSARELILEALVQSGRYDEAEAEARRYLAEDPDRHYAAIRLCELALRKGDGEEAARLATTFVDREPAFAYRILAGVQDHRGLIRNDVRQRLAAAATMRSLASLVENEAIRAEALIFAAEVGHEAAPALPQSDVLEQRIRSDLKDALIAANAASQAGNGYPYEMAVGRIRILSTDPDEAALGAKMLRPNSSGALKQDVAVAALARYHVERGEWREAVDLTRNLEDPYQWHRLYWLARRGGEPEQALALIEAGPLANTPEGAMLRSELLVQSSDPARKEEALKALRAEVEDPATSPGAVIRALVLIAVGGGVPDALACADRARLEERRDPQITALLASLLSAGGSERGLALAERLAAETDELSASRDLMRLLGGGGGTDAFERYVEAQVEKGGHAAQEHRIHRSLALLARASAMGNDQDGARALRERARADLEALRANADATKPELVAAFQLAASLGEAELAGAILGRAFAMRGDPDLLDARVLAFAREIEDADVLARMAGGMRAAAAESPAKEFLNIFADLLVSPSGGAEPATVRRLEEAAKEAGSRPAALELAGRIAFGEGELADAERLARLLLADEPRNAGALEILGAALLRRGAPDEVLALYGAVPEEAKREAAYRQTVRALLDRGRKDEALVTARAALRRFPASPTAHLLVAQLYRDLGETRKALSLLNLAPAHLLVVHMRAELLRQLGDHGMAERLYELLLVSSRFTDLHAWQGLMETLTETKRTKEFVVFCERALAGASLRDRPEVSSRVHWMRGMCLEVDGKIEEALADYEASVRLDDQNWGALNNAAWHIARTASARVAEARAYIDRALQLRPDDPALLDTAAEVYSVQQDHEAALRLIDRAIELGLESRKRGYAVHKAEILLRGQREEEARSLLERIRAQQGEDPAAQRARSLLWEIERKNMPEEEPATLPDVPEDEEDSPEMGGGE